jgi:alkyl hydroperoxide reductase subunit F
VTLLENWEPIGVEGDTYARRLLIQGPDGVKCTLDVDVIFVELGLKPHTELIKSWVEVDSGGRVVVDSNGQTSIPGLFAAGDVTNEPAEQVVIAIGDGAKAALNAYEYLLRCEEC